MDLILDTAGKVTRPSDNSTVMLAYTTGMVPLNTANCNWLSAVDTRPRIRMPLCPSHDVSGLISMPCTMMPLNPSSTSAVDMFCTTT